jgi:capsular exopolysaccharide synthesis family protein
MRSSQQPDSSVPVREIHLRDYWKVVWQGRWTILAVFVTVVAATVAWTFLQTPLYQATAIVEIQPQARRIMSSGDVSGLGAAGYGWFAEEKYHNTQIEIIRSRDVSQRVVRNLALDRHPGFSGPDPVKSFQRLIQVNPRRDTGLLEVSIVGRDRDEITRWVNEVAHAYVQRNFDKARENAERSVDAIRRQMAELSHELSDAEEIRIDTLQETQIFDSENQQEIVRHTLNTYAAELTTANLERNKLAETIQQVRRVQEADGDLLAVPELAADERLRELHGKRADLARQLERDKVDLRPGHPTFEKTQGELRQATADVKSQIDTVVRGLENRYDAAVRRADYLAQEIEEAKRTSLDVAKATSKYNIIKTDAETKKLIFDLIAKTLNEISLNMELMNNNVQVLDEAIPPLTPIKPRKRLNLMVGALLGLCLGLGAVFFLDYLDNTIRSPEDVEKYLGVSVLGVVPKMTDEGLAQRAIKEAFQSLRTSIIFSSKNRQRKVILVTSTGPREGKSSTVANLGRTLAAAGDRVIIVDCDLRRPKQHHHFQIDREPGVTNYLAAPADERDWTPYVKVVGPGELHLMTCGPIPPSPPELLSNTRFADLVAALRERYDWVLLDSPPAASLSDAALLASSADMIVPVVKHNATDRDHVIKTVNGLRAVNPDLPGIVLNHVDLDRAYHKDYYYAGYYYSEEDKPARTRRRGVERKVG